MMIKKCEWCGNEYITNRSYQRFCCKQCKERNVGKKKNPNYKPRVPLPKIKVCPICSKEFKPRDSKHTYCSRECQYNSSGKERTAICKNCNEVFEIKRRDIANIFCSRECCFKYKKVNR